MFYYPKGWGDW